MTRIPAALLTMMMALPPAAAQAVETLIAARTLPAGTVLSPTDVAVVDSAVAGGLSHPDEVVGRETRVAVYAGRPLRPEDIGARAVVDRNQRVGLIYRRGGLTIRTEGRALDRAGIGEDLRVMNISSRATVTGRVLPDGTVLVGSGG
ncbi:flagellar basal body P-ring formation chaperone FlgA [Frigidibacter sp. MR17.24]|uniref:flagellar basal body P-ring formation chaperone FlgA n=1 Tax=Frigidibacter sp. MR17.24 TaxID=3127345 RepID=UPI003012EE9E